MPDPALYVIVRDGRHEVRLDRSGALSLPETLFGGPDAWSDPHGRIEAEPYDEVWASGGVLLDHDRRLLRWYNRLSVTDDSLGLRRALMPLLAQCWPGWTVQHADRGYAAVIDGLPVDPAALLMSDPPPRPVTAAGMLAGLNAPSSVLGQPLSLDEYVATADPFEHLGNLRGYGLTVLSVRDTGRTVRDYVGGMLLTGMLATGPRLLAILDDVQTAAVPGELYVGDGGLLDVADRTIAVWQACSGRLEPASWPGWRVTVHHDGLPGHLRRCGHDDTPLRLPARTVLAEACMLFAYDTRQAEHHYTALLNDPDWPGVTGRRRAVLHRLAKRAANDGVQNLRRG
ncbi:hypothetical protein [Actinoplanes utahensis]|uniref:Uncharacterized protein n=1 Tax=Actinoplanes utahensis TaxID=1869 RepID=A0A0A6UIV5_ACTUT|nr:hypothetical protein [Actinoplanes utahensis]KHD75008.1 hypothetical protein MB27_25685 [Actinoplanes utahensis]GIF34882.1 hypothetical protein Aut01nite_78680 [Actinoplanes utahensis]